MTVCSASEPLPCGTCATCAPAQSAFEAAFDKRFSQAIDGTAAVFTFIYDTIPAAIARAALYVVGFRNRRSA